MKGHDIALHVDLSGARIEDFLYLASKSGTPLLAGALTMKAALHIPPGAQPVHERLNLKGAFNLDDVRFTSAKIQDKITELSLRGQGRPKDVKGADPGSIQSAMQGDFHDGRWGDCAAGAYLHRAWSKHCAEGDVYGWKAASLTLQGRRN